MSFKNEDSIPVCLDRLKEKIQEFGDKEFSTIDVLEKYSGKFAKNDKTPGAYSFNALFGKLLKRRAEFLGIEETAKDVNERSTMTSKWRIKSS